MKTALLISLMLLVFLPLYGCTGRKIEYETHHIDGSWEKFVYHNDSFDTKAGSVLVEKDTKGPVKVQMENLDTNSRAWQTMDKLIDKVPKPVIVP